MKFLRILFLCITFLLIASCNEDDNTGSSPLIVIEEPSSNFSTNKGEILLLKIKSNDSDGLIDKVEIGLNDSIV